MYRPRNTLLVLTIALALPCLASEHGSAQDNWPQFRGPGSRGISDNQGLADTWSATKNVDWKTEIPGRGWSSPVVWGKRIFLTTVVNLGESEAPKKGLYYGGDRLKPPPSVHQWKVIALDLETGKVIWEKQVHEGKPQSAIHIKNSFASETPIVDADRLYCVFGNVGVFCFTHDGEEVWSREIKARKTRNGWGTAASPALFGDRLYLTNDNDEESYLLALDKKTGREIWRTPRDEKSNWSTPFIWQNKLRTEIVTPGTGKVRSYDLDGKLLWSLAGMSSITIATPYESEGLLYVTSGFVMDKTKPIYAIRPGASGDISLANGENSNEWIVWCQWKGAPYNPSTIVFEDRLFVLYDMGIITCFNARDGSVIYERTRIPRGRRFTASPWTYDGKLFCLNEDGVTFVLGAGDEFRVLHENPLQDDDMAMATPAAAGDRLLIRTSARIYCIRDKTRK